MHRAWTDADGQSAGNTRLLVTVGSDHHPFDRLIGWVDTWLAGQPKASVSAVVQYGTARPPRFGQGVAWVDHADLGQLMVEATVIVSQGGPYSILESVDVGRMPIAVPRRRALGEVVDDHQHAFCMLMSELEHALVVTTERDLHEALDRAVADPTAFRVPPRVSAVDDTIKRFAGLVADLRPRRRRRALVALGRALHRNA
jgi:UDP-N-acetylglucosamine transferase subunit ALG13